jgi:hypothetical protein
MESDNGGVPYFFDGETTCGVNEATHCKYVAYPAQHMLPTTGAFASRFTTSGTITIIVPVADVGNQADAKMFSATGVTGTQAEPSCTSATSTCAAIFNVIDSSAPYDFTPL